MNKENYNERLSLIKEKIDYLIIMNIEFKNYKNIVDSLEKDIEKKYKEIIDTYTSPLLELMIDNLYKNALYRLKFIECDFLPYNDYLNTCLLVKNISISIDKNDLSEKELNELINILENKSNELLKLHEKTKKITDLMQKSQSYAKVVIPMMEKVRAVADRIEPLLGEEFKAFPSYEDLLYSVQ